VRLECHENAGDFQVARPGYEALHNVPMPAMNTVEGPNGDYGCRDVGR
jgi:hypothetical protein